MDFLNLHLHFSPKLGQLFDNPSTLLGLFLISCLVSIFRYLSWSTALYWAFYKLFNFKKTQPRPPTKDMIKREIRWSLISCCVYGAMTSILVVSALKEKTALYLDWQKHGTAYFFLSPIIMIALHDLYFWSTHWMSHKIPLVFKHIHHVHHQSRNPTPFADIMFHPIDAVIHAGFVPLLVFMLPMHPLPFLCFLHFVMLINALGHTGYEFFPEIITRHRALNWINTPTNHNRHHTHIDGNFGLYTNIWDRCFNTFVHETKKGGAEAPP